MQRVISLLQNKSTFSYGLYLVTGNGIQLSFERGWHVVLQMFEKYLSYRRIVENAFGINRSLRRGAGWGGV